MARTKCSEGGWKLAVRVKAQAQDNALPGPLCQVRNLGSLKIPTRRTQNFWSSASHLACRRVPAEPVFQPACRHVPVHTHTHIHTHPARPILLYRILLHGPHLPCGALALPAFLRWDSRQAVRQGTGRSPVAPQDSLSGRAAGARALGSSWFKSLGLRAAQAPGSARPRSLLVWRGGW